jgi:trehalose synthase
LKPHRHLGAQSPGLELSETLREGFGLVVSEALWKETAVVAGRAGGIPLQMRDGAGGFLIDSVEECAGKTLRLLKDPEEGQQLARRGRELVRERFLITRLIADELRLYGDLLGTRQPRSAVAKAGLTVEERDPVCGMHLDIEVALEYEYAGCAYRFCSQTCLQQFEGTPEPFLRTTA